MIKRLLGIKTLEGRIKDLEARNEDLLRLIVAVARVMSINPKILKETVNDHEKSIKYIMQMK